MTGTGRILRKAIHEFLRRYQSYASTAMFLVFPAAASMFFSQGLITMIPNLMEGVEIRTKSLLTTAGFPVSMGFFSLLSMKLSQTIFSLAFTIPFTLTFLALAKAAIIQLVVPFHSQPSSQGSPSVPFTRLYFPLVQTIVANYFTIISANASVLCLFFIAFNIANILQLSSVVVTILSVVGGIVYSIVLANVLVTCNLAVVVSGVQRQGGYLQILKAFLLIRGRTSTALSLAIPTNLGMAAIEALFQYRVMKAYSNSNHLHYSMVWEAFTITYLYSILVVIDTIVSCLFFETCKLRNLPIWGSDIYHQANEQLLEEECPDADRCSKC